MLKERGWMDCQSRAPCARELKLSEIRQRREDNGRAPSAHVN